MSEKLDPLEYQALETFLAHAKDKNDLSEVSSRFEPRINRRLRFALLKILRALRPPDRQQLLTMESFELLENLIRQQLSLERTQSKYCDEWWRIERLKNKAHNRYERRYEAEHAK
jgi:hypothetical protein